MSQYVGRVGPRINTALRKWCYNLSGFNKYGLHLNDVYDDFHDEDVVEAVRRLPKKLQDERNFRISRAIQLSANHRVLPKEQWTKYEEDYKYLDPYLEEVKREREEKSNWFNNH